MQTGSVHEGIPTSSTSGTIPKQKPKGQIDSDKSSQVVEKTLEELQQGVQQQRSMPVSEGRTISQVLDGAAPGGKVGDMSSILGGKEMPIGRLSQEADGLPVLFPNPLKDGAVRSPSQLPRDEMAVALKSVSEQEEDMASSGKPDAFISDELSIVEEEKKIVDEGPSSSNPLDAFISVEIEEEVSSPDVALMDNAPAPGEVRSVNSLAISGLSEDEEIFCSQTLRDFQGLVEIDIKIAKDLVDPLFNRFENNSQIKPELKEAIRRGMAEILRNLGSVGNERGSITVHREEITFSGEELEISGLIAHLPEDLKRLAESHVSQGRVRRLSSDEVRQHAQTGAALAEKFYAKFMIDFQAFEKRQLEKEKAAKKGPVQKRGADFSKTSRVKTVRGETTVELVEDESKSEDARDIENRIEAKKMLNEQIALKAEKHAERSKAVKARIAEERREDLEKKEEISEEDGVWWEQKNENMHRITDDDSVGR